MQTVRNTWNLNYWGLDRLELPCQANVQRIMTDSEQSLVSYSK